MQYSSETLKEYEDFLSSLQLFPELFRIKDVEMDLKGELNPSSILDDLFFKQKQWLSFTGFFDFYFNRYKDEIKKRFAFPEYECFLQGLRARLYRTQFGFLTEYHAFFLSSILFGVENVTRSTDMDIAGVDFQVKLENNLYNIHIFVDTLRAWSFRNYKSQYNSLQAGKFNSLRFLKNRFGVYTEAYLRYFENEARSGRIKNNTISGTTATGFIYAE
jgi:TaqI restriction endonuclease